MSSIATLIGSHRLRYSSEYDLQDGIASILTAAGIGFQREVVLGSDRLDFLIDGTTALEVKVGGSPSALVRQIHRYAAQGGIESIIVVTTKRQHVIHIPPTINGKPVEAIHVGAFL